MTISVSKSEETAPGRPAPLGATVVPMGINFAIFSKFATKVELLLFEDPESPLPFRVVSLDKHTNRTNYYWHIFIPDLSHGQVYAWRLDGPHNPARGHRFDGKKVLLDPYGRAVAGLSIYDREAAKGRGDNCSRALRSVAIDPTAYNWADDVPLQKNKIREVIYEMHVAGFTSDASSGLDPELRGTYAGLVKKIPYLKELGVTAVEFLPVHHFDPQDAPSGLTNYWGYSSLSYFAPHSGFAYDTTPAGCVKEFKDMIKSLHKAGIKVILDVVYNHTAEGGSDGPTICWRGFENSAYYMLNEDKATFANYSGCGNTINANHSIVRRMILDSLRCWVGEYHIDGFRFDLASALSRGEDGKPLPNAPVLWAIESEPLLAGTSLIAEAWDAAGLYQVGSFTGDRFAEWNGPFRDDVRRFLKGDEGTIENLMARIVGSPDLFDTADAIPSRSINFVTCHDGFSLRDLVSYNTKDNLQNKEENRDGSNDNLSWNCGHEGITDNADINKLRQQQMRNFMCLLFLSHGTPMVLMGDEVAQSHQGNNNPWCQNNELTWFDWKLLQTSAQNHRFLQYLIKITQNMKILQDDHYWQATSPTENGDISWHGTEISTPDWRSSSHVLAYTLEHKSGSEKIHVMLNAGSQEESFALPAIPKSDSWLGIIDTSVPSPGDITAPEKAKHITGKRILVQPHSIVVVMAKT